MKKFLLVLLFSSSLGWSILQAQHVIPELSYSTLLGGDLGDEVTAVTVDQAGNLYIVGRTQSLTFPIEPRSHHQPQGGLGRHGIDAYVAKFDPTGSELLYILWFNAISATDIDEAFAIAVDADGNAYVTGHTRSADFCTLFGDTPGYDTEYNGNGDAFLLKINPEGTGLDYCTFLGGDDWDLGTAVVLDAQQNAYVTGGTWSTTFPTTDNAYDADHNGLRDTFVAILDASGMNLTYATFIGGSNQEESKGIIRDTVGNLYVAGWTNSDDLPTTPDSYAPSFGGGFDGFVYKLNPTATELLYVTYLGGSEEDRATALVHRLNGEIVVAGYTRSTDIWETADLQGTSDLFVMGLNASGTATTFTTLLGGSGEDQALGITRSLGTLFVTGTTWSDDFAQNGRLSGVQDSFLLQLDGAGTAVYATYIGGNAEENGTAITATHQHLYLAGDSRSEDFPTTDGAYNHANSGDYDIYAQKQTLTRHTAYLPILHTRR
ncbi:MAG: SBBP repeat-containing protein [Chloroflexota bacterium]